MTKREVRGWAPGTAHHPDWTKDRELAKPWQTRALEAEKERDALTAEVARLRGKLDALVTAIHDTTLRCRFDCTEESHCGQCGTLFAAIAAARGGE